MPTILTSVEKTGHLVLADQATRHASAASIIAAEVAEHGFSSLKAPIKQVTAPHTPVPFAPSLEKLYLPNADKIEAAVRAVMAD